MTLSAKSFCKKHAASQKKDEMLIQKYRWHCIFWHISISSWIFNFIGTSTRVLLWLVCNKMTLNALSLKWNNYDWRCKNSGVTSGQHFKEKALWTHTEAELFIFLSSEGFIIWAPSQTAQGPDLPPRIVGPFWPGPTFCHQPSFSPVPWPHWSHRLCLVAYNVTNARSSRQPTIRPVAPVRVAVGVAWLRLKSSTEVNLIKGFLATVAVLRTWVMLGSGPRISIWFPFPTRTRVCCRYRGLSEGHI